VASNACSWPSSDAQVLRLNVSHADITNIGRAASADANAV
jgi:hypothetical protein